MGAKCSTAGFPAKKGPASCRNSLNASVLVYATWASTEYRSADLGRSWAPVQVPGGASIAAGAVRPNKAGLVLVNAAGQLVLGNLAGTEFKLLQPAQGMRLTGVVVLDDHSVVSCGLGGIRTQRLPAAQP